MRKCILYFFLCGLAATLEAQNVGIGTTTPKASFNVAENKTVLFGADTSGTGSKLIWYASKGAFRAGYSKDDIWNYSNVGLNSFAVGDRTTASGVASIATGIYSTASGFISTAMGNNSTASGDGSTAIGNNAIASGIFSTAMGQSTLASGNLSTTFGYKSVASGNISFAAGNGSISSGENSAAMGYGAQALGIYSFANGFLATAASSGSIANGTRVTANAYLSTVLGVNNDEIIASPSNTWIASEPLLIIGNGNYPVKSNAMVILKNGNTGIGVSAPTQKLEVAGTIKTTNLQMTTGAANGTVLTSDASGNASWQTPASATNYWSASGSNISNNNAGNIGIGTSSPTSAKLVISGTLGQEGLDLSSTDQYANMRVLRNSLGSIDKDMYFGYNSGANSSLHLFSNNIETMTIKEGNVGMGTTAPNAPLQFATSNQKRKIVLFETANNDNQFFGFGVFGGQLRYQTGVLTDDHVFYSAASASVSNELMRIKGNGNIGIGTSSPNAPLQFANNTVNRKIVFYEAANNDHQFNGFGLNPGVMRYQVNNTGDDHAFYAGTSSSTSNELFRIKGNGNVGVGTTNPLSKLEINGAMATKMLRFLSGNSITLDNSATVWDLALNTSITLPVSTSCPNRRYIIINRYATPMTITAPGYIDFNSAFSYQVPPNGSIELIAYENIWWRIK